MMRRGIVKSIRKTSNMLEYVKNNPYRILGVYGCYYRYFGKCLIINLRESIANE